MDSIEIIGYIAMVLVAISLSLNNMFWLRVVNMLGAVFFVAYGLVIQKYPIVALNAFLTFMNIYHIYKLKYKQK